MVFSLAYVTDNMANSSFSNRMDVSCGQILYAWLLRRETLPRSYTNWYVTTTKAFLRLTYF